MPEWARLFELPKFIKLLENNWKNNEVEEQKVVGSRNTQSFRFFTLRNYIHEARTNITAEFGEDPCIDRIVPNAFLGVGRNLICNKMDGKDFIVIRFAFSFSFFL